MDTEHEHPKDQQGERAQGCRAPHPAIPFALAMTALGVVLLALWFVLRDTGPFA